jgi:cellulose synthase/poly-beta-1,6-N-acetylglucosamine synthase-like glycosyltransferase
MSLLILLSDFGAVLVCFAYFALITLFTIGWFRLRKNDPAISTETPGISVIIAARNEEANIAVCIESISKQDYPSGLFEIIIVDDHSSDSTVVEINKQITANPGIQIRLLQMTGDEVGKKAAITKAVSLADNEWIVTTDADCVMDRNWLSSLMAHAVDSGVQMIMATVVFKKTKSVFGNLQELEFLSLIASGAGAVSMGLPIMCNGANLVYRSNAFRKTGGYDSDKKFASGDDIFLMMRIRKMFGSNAIRFVKSPLAIVRTDAVPTLSEFINQRLRWVSKSKAYRDPWIVLSSIIIFAQSLVMLIFLLAWALGFIGTGIPLSLFAVKLFADLPIMISVCRFTNRGRLLFWFIPLQLVYPLYVAVMGVLGNTLSFSWKGRKSGKFPKRI